MPSRLQYWFLLLLAAGSSATDGEAGDAAIPLVTETCHYDQILAKVDQVALEAQEQMDALKARLIQQEEEISNLMKDPIRSKSSLVPIRFRQSPATIPQSCHQISLADPNATSGMYYIDPDGENVGELPIYVFCDMSTGSTLVGHDSESSIQVSRCADAGCYQRPINYMAPMMQIKALSAVSTQCRQSIQYDCSAAPLEFNGIQYSFWNDINGEKQYFWAGGNASRHVCQCGIDGTCVSSDVPCNCDSLTVTSDQGYITDKKYLPIKQLNFGRTNGSPISSGRHTLGKLECSGDGSGVVDPSAVPKSCGDLAALGHDLAGFYLVKSKTSNHIETVFCNFDVNSKGVRIAGEWRIGSVDVKSSPVLFYVSRNSPYGVPNSPIPFEVEQLNIGGGMDLETGVFTAPKAGRYSFDLSGMRDNVTDPVHISMRLNEGCESCSGESCHRIASAYGVKTVGYVTYAFHSILDLNKDDKIVLCLEVGTIYDNDNRLFTHFTGTLIEEDLAI